MLVDSLANRRGGDALLRPLSQLNAAEVCSDKCEAHEGHDEMRTPRGRPPTEL